MREVRLRTAADDEEAIHGADNRTAKNMTIVATRTKGFREVMFGLLDAEPASIDSP